MNFFPNFPKVIKFILTFALLSNVGPAHGANLGQFGLPPCCYAELPLPSEVRGQVTPSEGRSLTDLDILQVDNNNATDAPPVQILKYLSPMNSKVVKTKRTANQIESTSAEKSAIDETLKMASDEAQSNDTLATHRHMPPDWKRKLRRFLFRSFKDRTDAAAASQNKTQALWEGLYAAPLQVIAAATRREVPTQETLSTLETIAGTERLAGVMVNTESGIELRTSDSIETRSVQLPPENCDCHLIHHGDTVLAYWSVGFAGNNLEYLIYPLPQNVPTPPIFYDFHPPKPPGIRPSPVDLNPTILSRSTNDVPFQASLEFGLAEASQHATYPRRLGRRLETLENQQLNRNFLGNRNGFGKEPAYSLGHPGVTEFQQGFGLPDYSSGNELQPGRDYPGNSFLAGEPGQSLPPFGLGPPQLDPNFQNFRFGQPNLQNLGFGGLPPFYPAIMYVPPPPPPFPARKEDPAVFQDTSLGQKPGGVAIGPLNPFNPNYPKSIQEILFGPVPIDEQPLPPSRLPGRGQFFPPGDDGRYELPPGPNPGGINPFDLYPYPRNPPGRTIPPRDQVVQTYPPGIYVQEVGQKRQPDCIDRGLTDRPVPFNREKEECYKCTTSSNCLRRYGGQRQYHGTTKGNNYDSSNSHSKVRFLDETRLTHDKSTDDPSYILNF